MDGIPTRVPPESEDRSPGRGLDHSVRVGISFGLTSGVITTLGLLVGLSSGTNSEPAVLGGIFTIAIADALSDALGIHVSEESEGEHTVREVWIATAATFAAKLVTALTFAVPVLLLDLDVAVWVSIAWGAAALTVLSADVARRQDVSPRPLILEHLSVAAVVVAAAHGVGLLVGSVFGV